MENTKFILDLEEPAQRVSNGINALGVMAMGLSRLQDPYADGFIGLWNYLLDADRALQRQISLCLNSISAE